ncbi:MAG: hypothetical protein KKD39_02600 [Candidatus Altiarchaeota archaeon]|nr:hypothetical protein [Candidatus Altiarchaeota archaeon]
MTVTVGSSGANEVNDTIKTRMVKPLSLGHAPVKSPISDKLQFEVIDPHDLRESQIYDFIKFRNSQEGGVGGVERQLHGREGESIFHSLLMRMTNGPIRLALVRYIGDDMLVGEPATLLKTGDVVASNESRQTHKYSPEYMRSLIAAQTSKTMDELTLQFTNPDGTPPFSTFASIRDSVDGPLKPNGGLGFLILALVDRRLRGQSLSTPLLTNVLAMHHDSIGHDYVFAYGRLPELGGERLPSGEDELNALRTEARQQFEQTGKVEIQTLNRYVQGLLDGNGRDWGLGFHRKAGAHAICGIPYSYDDPASLNCGALVIYDLKELRRQARI